MRLVIACILGLVLVSSVLAASGHSGWYFSGDTFEADGVVYSVEGISEDSVLLGIGSRLLFISKDDCVIEGLTEYCYDDYGDNVKYEAGDEYFDYHISITTDDPAISFSREVSNTKPLPGEIVEVKFKIENSGEYNLRDLEFEETLPEGVVIKSGSKKDSDTIYSIRPSFHVGSVELVHYSFLVQTLDSFSVEPNISYRYGEQKYTTTGPQMSISVDTVFEVESEVEPSSIQLDQEGIYTLKITNNHDDEATFQVKIAVPEAIRVTSFEEVKIGSNDQEYVAEFDINDGKSKEITLGIYPRESGSYSIDAEVSANIAGISSKLTDKASFASVSDVIEATLSISPPWDEFFSGTDITVRGVLENMNTETKFLNIEGSIESDLFDPLEFSRGQYLPQEKHTEVELKFVAPKVNETKEYPVTLSGKYRSPSGKTFVFDRSGTITLKPFVSKVEITREVEPEMPERGKNVTITVDMTNIYDTYITADVTERIPNDLVKSGGLTFKELSLERDASEELYIYTIDIPEDYPHNSFNVTTIVLVEDDPLPEEYTTTIAISDPETEEEEQEEEEVVVETDTAVVEKEDKPGVFSRMWQGVKGGVSWFVDALAGVFGFGESEAQFEDNSTNSTQ